MKPPQCSVDDCDRDSAVEVRLYDVYPDGTVFDQLDFTCPFLCRQHLKENEEGARGERKGRGMVNYPFTNRENAVGFTIYRPFSERG
jgi:hypothetical protein